MTSRSEMSLNSIPTAPRILGLAGLIPFAAGALIIWLAPAMRAEVTPALIAYGAVILSFLGGIRWGFAVSEGSRAGWRAYSLSVTPSLVGWIGTLIGGRDGLILLAAALALWFFAERAIPPALDLPQWYPRLRAILTAIAALSLFGAALVV